MALTFMQRLALRHHNDPDYVEPCEDTREDYDETNDPAYYGCDGYETFQA